LADWTNSNPVSKVYPGAGAARKGFGLTLDIKEMGDFMVAGVAATTTNTPTETPVKTPYKKMASMTALEKKIINMYSEQPA
jgi:hypothetical protein